MILVIDNYDSFTYNLVDYFMQLHGNVEVLRNDDPKVMQIDVKKYQGVVLSPGPKRPSDAGFLMPFIHQNHKLLPMLGVCLGHQAIGEYFGAQLIRAPEPMHGRTSKIYFDQDNTLFHNLLSGVKMMRYHSLLLADQPCPDLRFTSYTESREVMSLQHSSLPLYGVQFHPESILSTYGMIILRNWLETLSSPAL